MKRTKLLLSIEAKGENGEDALRRLVEMLHERLSEPEGKQGKPEAPAARKGKGA